MITGLNTKKNTYAFGMPMPGRNYQSSNSYRYGMNGQEKDLEIFEGAMTAEFWEYDSRIGRRWNVDPIVKDWESPYACFSNNPIYYADPAGSNTVTPIPEITLPDVTIEAEGPKAEPGPKAPELPKGEERDIDPKIETSPDNGTNDVSRPKAYADGIQNAFRSATFFGYGNKTPEQYSPDDRAEQMSFAKGKLAGDIILMISGGASSASGWTTLGATSGVIAVEASSVLGLVAVPATATVGYLAGVIQLAVGTTLLTIATDNANETSAWIRSNSAHGGNFEKMGKQKGSSAEKMPDDVAKKLGINAKAFKNYLHKMKKLEKRGGADNYSWDELIKMGEEFKQLK